jgi:hypothetical protein
LVGAAGAPEGILEDVEVATGMTLVDRVVGVGLE